MDPGRQLRKNYPSNEEKRFKKSNELTQRNDTGYEIFKVIKLAKINIIIIK